MVAYSARSIGCAKSSLDPRTCQPPLSRYRNHKPDGESHEQHSLNGCVQPPGHCQGRSTINLITRIPQPGEKRSEEHTSELQSLTNLVCRLLLETNKH